MWKKIRKFGLEYYDLPTMIWNVAFMLRALGLNIDSQYKKGIPQVFYIIISLFGMSYFYVYLVSMLWFVFWRCQETGELVSAIIVFSLGISSEIGTVKLIFMYAYRKTIRYIIDGYRDCDALAIPNSRIYQNLMKTLRYVKTRAIVFWIVIIGNGVVYIAKPIILPGRHLMEDTQILMGLEPMLKSPNYEIAFLLSMAGIIFTVYLPANISALLIVLSGYTEAQMLALSEELIHLWDDTQKHYKSFHNEKLFNADNTFSMTDHNKNTIINKHINNKLVNIIKTHTMNMNLVRQVELVFREPIAIEFMILTISLIAELLGGLENTYMQIPFAFIQVSMDCVTGQRLMDASYTFEKAVYDCKWENFDVKNRKSVLIILQISQKTMTLSAGYVTTLNFASLMAVIKSIYSAYTTLRSIMN